MRRKLWLLLACLIVCLLPLQGCKFKDIDLRMFVVAIGIDTAEDPSKVKVTLKLAIPQGDPKTGEEKVDMISRETATIAEAIREMKSMVDKELDFGHCKAMILGESYARRDITEAMDWAIRRRDIQLIMYCAIGRPNASEVLAVQPKTERIPSNSLFLALGKEGTESPFILSSYSFDVKRRLMERGLDPVLPIVEALSKERFVIDKVVLFSKKSSKLVLNPDETRLYNLLTQKDLLTNFTVVNKQGVFDYNVDGSRSKYSIHAKGKAESAPYISYKIDITGVLEEVHQKKMINRDTLNLLSRSSSEDLNSQIRELLFKIRDSGTDPIGWGLRYMARNWDNKTEYEKWKKMYPEMDFKVHAKVNVKYTGMIR
ncbi:Ger(x)C family spore germination protein [Paenibacillus sp. CAA11]|uniref:Ger(x)C family spore germination protein n=1 Tax=Paenibacillus sp. CAA11 TaxID=1532905 RepID=UPI000D3AAC03|nr:Ger(x)C family spore germination protein [Paenibacillus sp. CAA11]AWB43595.1 Ger(x)C family spore germination protein [Paenibacillus sp. CAA11]